MSQEKNLLEEREYLAWDAHMIKEREKAMSLTLRFNNTGEKAFLEELFNHPLDDVFIGTPLHCNYGGDFVLFGHRVFINANCTFQPAGGVEIGDDVYIGSDAKFYTTIHPIDPEERAMHKATVRPIKIGAKVWIGGGAIVLPGVEIGEGTTIGAGSVVTRSIPPRCVAVGNPCRVIRKLNSEGYEKE
ncbi:MAG: sugar O-acetyltransferase [Prevotellaceae bacterium]|nr:sugar O-acetyltransferase [Prevotellaceae bacterium]